MKTLTTILSLLLLGLAQAQAQNSPRLYGNVFDQAGEALIGATVQWDGTSIGTVTDERGDFWLDKMDTTARLLIHYVGYDPLYVEMFPYEDTVFIKVEGVAQLQTVQVTAQLTDNYTSTLDPLNMQRISSCELKKAACCNLSESFETSGSIDVMRQDAVTSATEIQLLGLRGIYSQLLLEKRPAYTGLGSPLALEFVPGTWVSGIQISKGTSTVQNGPQAITGQINVELAKPWQDKPLFVNLFGATTGRGEANLHVNKRWNEQWSSGLLLHGSTTQGEFDRNADRFVDQPKKKTLDALWRNYYVTEVFSTQFNVQVISDTRESGQVGAFDSPSGGYRIRQQNDRVDLFGKLGYVGFEKPETSVGLIYGASWHRTDNAFGNSRYNGTQHSLYANLLYASFLGTTDHRVNLGASFQSDDYTEYWNQTDFSRLEVMPGAFGEYNFSRAKFGLIAGLRIDHHNKFGTFLTPRLNLKYNFNELTILRMSGGRGLRSAQVLSENMAVMASNRQLVLDQQSLGIEDAWNIGLNFTKSFDLLGRSASLVADLYRTQFVNQVVMDMESEHGKVLFYNLQGKSFSNSLLLVASWAAFKGFDLKLAYKLNDVRTSYHDHAGVTDLVRRPMTAPHRALATLNYTTPGEKWMFNSNIQYTGWQRFADASHIPSSLADKQYFTGYSPGYVLVNAQVTRRFKNLELYLGGENLTNYRQEHAILDWQNPFGEHFDAMQVWGPLVGARGYAGLRWWLDAPKG